MPVSGNHGRSSTEPSPQGVAHLVPPTTPQQSTRGFVAPSSVPIKRTPDITDVIGESGNQKIEKEFTNYELQITNDGVQPQLNEEIAKDEKFLLLSEEKVAASDTDNVPLPDADRHLMTEEVKTLEIATQARNDNEKSSSNFEEGRRYEDFPTAWRTAFNNIFSSIPTIYIPLKEKLPEIENNIIKINVKNDIQKEHFKAKTRDVLAYLRTHFDEKVEDIVVKTNEQLETKKVIYDVKDKLQNFKEQNIEFDDFIQILDLKIKD